MREIKFRAWDKKNRIFTKPFNLAELWNDGVEAECNACSMFNNGEYNIAHIEDFEFVEYTGLKDKNGKEIYEGDILMEDGVLSIVEYKDDIPGFGLNNSKYSLCMYSSEKMEIIGNIYENKELLK